MRQFFKMTFATITGVIFCSVITFVFIGQFAYRPYAQ